MTEPAVDQPLIHARGLTKRFGEFTAVDGIDVDVAPGESFGFLGPNGAGKTSTMRMVACVSPVTAGTLRILDLDPTHDGARIRGRLGVVPQQDTLDTELSVKDNLVIYGRYFGLSRKEAARRGDDFAAVEERLVRAARGQPWYGYLDLEDAVDWEHERRFIQEAYEPLEALARVRCPFLAVFGARDVLVPVWESAQMCGQALSDAGNLDATVVVFPQGNHRILIEETRQFVPGYLDLLGDWALHRVARHEHPGMRRDRTTGRGRSQA